VNAFRYAVEAGDEAISRGAHTDALVYCHKAVELVDSLHNCRVLVKVVDNAIEILRPSGVVADIVRRMKKAGNAAATIPQGVGDQLDGIARRGSFDSNGLLTSYTDIKGELEEKLLEFDQSTIVKNSSNQGSCCLPLLCSSSSSDYAE